MLKSSLSHIPIHDEASQTSKETGDDNGQSQVLAIPA
jgi:hypothetical protein